MRAKKKPAGQILTEWALGEFQFNVGYGIQKLSRLDMERLVRYINNHWDAASQERDDSIDFSDRYVMFNGGLKVQLFLIGDARFVVTKMQRDITVQELARYYGLQGFLDAN